VRRQYKWCADRAVRGHMLKLEWPALEGWCGQDRPGSVEINLMLCGRHDRMLPSFQGTFFRFIDWDLPTPRPWWKRLLKRGA
jgi:hypothetical protein